MEIILEKANQDDIPALLVVCRAAAKTQGSTWDDHYPNAEILPEDVGHSALYKIMAGDDIIGLLSCGETGELSMLSDPSCGARPFDFARFGIHPRCQGKGFGHAALAAAVGLCARLGGTSVRVLVSPGNPAALRVYQREGFEIVRRVHLWERDYLYCRKRISESSTRRPEDI